MFQQYNIYYQIGKGKKKIILINGQEKYTFRYNPREEDKLLDTIIETAKNKGIFKNFDWYDAAVLSFKLTQSLIGQADELLVKVTNQYFKPGDFYKKS